MQRRSLVMMLAALALPAAHAAGRADTVVLLYSRTGNTATLAQEIARVTGARIVRIEPREPYASDYSAMTDIARSEIRSWKRRELKPVDADFSGVKNVFVCGPLWWGNLDVPMRTFLMDHPLDGKDVYPVTTSGSSSPEGVVSDIRKLCPKAKVHPEFWVPGSSAAGSLQELRAWLRKAGF